jgi:hypothetical protein
MGSGILGWIAQEDADVDEMESLREAFGCGQRRVALK